MLPPCVVVNGSPEHKTWVTQVVSHPARQPRPLHAPFHKPRALCTGGGLLTVLMVC